MNHSIKNLFFVALALFTLKANAGISTITGTLSNAEGKKLYFEQYVKGVLQKLDSVKLDKTGKFTFKATHDKVEFYRISTKSTDFAVFITSPNEKISVTGDAEKLNKTYKVKGSVYSSHIKEFSDVVNNYVVERDTISARFKRAMAAGKTEESEKLGKDLGAAYDKFLVNRNEFLKKYPNSPATFAVMSHLNPQTDYDLIKKIELALEKTMPGSFFYEQVKSNTRKIEEAKLAEELKAKEAERLAKSRELTQPGKIAPDVIMADSMGITKTLSKLRGNYVLLDFWASWCGPCRAENPNVVRNYRKYKDKGFTVMSVSLDTDRTKWLAAIKKDGLEWPNHVSELKGWQTSVLPNYGINSIPYTVLIDKEGKIIQTNLRGPALEAKLKEIFGY